MIPATGNTSDGYFYPWVYPYTSHVVRSLHEQNCKLAKYLHETLFIYALYGALDGLSLAYSTTKYCFDMMAAFTANGQIVSSDAMHDWMLTPVGIATVITESLLLVTLSVLANIIDDEEKDEFRSFRVEIENNQPRTDKSLYLYLDGTVIRATAKNKKGITENFILKETQLGTEAAAIKDLLLNKASNFSKGMLEKISDATSNRDNVQAKNNLYVGWRYCRDMLKGLKNAYKGFRAVMWSANYMKNGMGYLLFPTALTFGILSGANRIWYRSMKDNRKRLQTGNKDLARAIRELEYLVREDAANFLNQIGSKSDFVRIAGMCSAAFGGLIDGLYLYMGALMLAPVSPLAFGFLVGCSTLFVVLLMTTRVFTEYEYQRKLVSSELSVRLAVCGKRMEALFADMQPEDGLVIGAEALVALNKELDTEINSFTDLQNKLLEQTELSTPMVALSGLRDGVAVGGAVGSLMFTIVTINAMLAIPCAPALVIGCAALSLALVIAGCANALLAQRPPGVGSPQQRTSRDNTLREKLEQLKEKKIALTTLTLEETKRVIWEGMAVDPFQESYWQQWAEVFRSLFSGIAKAQKAVDYTLNPMQDVDDQGHSQDTPFMVWATLIYGCIFAVVLALRSDAREFNDKLNQNTPPPQGPGGGLADQAALPFSTDPKNDKPPPSRGEHGPGSSPVIYVGQNHSDLSLLPSSLSISGIRTNGLFGSSASSNQRRRSLSESALNSSALSNDMTLHHHDAQESSQNLLDGSSSSPPSTF